MSIEDVLFYKNACDIYFNSDELLDPKTHELHRELVEVWDTLTDGEREDYINGTVKRGN